MHHKRCRLADATSAAQQISSVMADGSDGAPDSDAISQLASLPRAQLDADAGPAAVPAAHGQQQHEPGQPAEGRASAGSLGAAGLPAHGVRLTAGRRMLMCVYVRTIITKHHDATWGSVHPEVVHGARSPTPWQSVRAAYGQSVSSAWHSCCTAPSLCRAPCMT